MPIEIALSCLALVALVLLVVAVLRRRSDLGSSADRATFAALHTASLAAPPLRDGLNRSSAQRAIRHLHALLATPAVALTDLAATLATAGDADIARKALQHAAGALVGGRTEIVSVRPDDVGFAPDNSTRFAVACPISDGGIVVGALVAYSSAASPVLVRAVEEVALWISAQVELASAELTRTRMVEAELRALRAQISPHFIYNSLTAIASFVRTDPERARELLLEFADFTRYALRRGGEFTRLSDELRNTERYLVLEQARFGERLRVSLRVAPEVLSAAVPFLSVQPLVENAVRHGIDGVTEHVHISISATDVDSDAVIVVEDDGAGSEPQVIQDALETEGREGGSVGLGNVDARLRQAYGDAYGLVVETAPGEGMKVTLRVPKYAPGVHADATSPATGT